MDSHITVKNKSEMIVDRIIGMIMKGELKPGERLPVENDLASYFDVSRVTIREAFKGLSLMGLVDIRQGDGTYVKTLSPESYMKPLLPMMLIDSSNIGDLYDARRSIESGAAYSAAKRRSMEDLDDLKKCHQIMRQHFNDYCEDSQMEYTKADKDFHYLIVKAANNLYFSKLFDIIYEILSIGIEKTSSIKVGREASIIEHFEIIRAIELQEADLAEKLMASHIRNAKNFYLNKVE